MCSCLIATGVWYGIAKAPKIEDERGKTEQGVETKEKSNREAISGSGEGLKVVLADFVRQYGLDYEQFYETIKCESGFNPDPIGNILSRGIAQFTLPTWLGYCSERDERLNALKSLECASKMWQQGLQYKWDCWCMRYGKENLNCIKRGF